MRTSQIDILHEQKQYCLHAHPPRKCVFDLLLRRNWLMTLNCCFSLWLFYPYFNTSFIYGQLLLILRSKRFKRRELLFLEFEASRNSLLGPYRRWLAKPVQKNYNRVNNLSSSILTIESSKSAFMRKFRLLCSTLTCTQFRMGFFRLEMEILTFKLRRKTLG